MNLIHYFVVGWKVALAIRAIIRGDIKKEH